MSPAIIKLNDSLQLLRSGKFSDFTIKCKNATFQVHKNILATHSEYFAAVFDSPFKEAIMNEHTFHETTSSTVAVVIAYIYTGILSEAENISKIWPQLFKTDPVQLFRNVDIYKLADQLMLFDLKTAVCDRSIKIIGRRLRCLSTEDKADERNLVCPFVRLVYDELGEFDDMLRPGVTKLLLEIESTYVAKSVPRDVIVIASDSESNSETDDESDQENDEEDHLRETSNTGVARSKTSRTNTTTVRPPPVQKRPATFQTTLRKLMDMAEEKEKCAVISGRALLQEFRKTLAAMKCRLGEAEKRLAKGSRVA